MIRLSPSLLESYRMYLVLDWYTEQKLIEAITGTFAPTAQVSLGKAYHRLLENFEGSHRAYFEIGNPSDYEMVAEQDGYLFNYEQAVAPVADFLEAEAVLEVYGNRSMDTCYGRVSFASKADAIWGHLGAEFKTTVKDIFIMKYHESAQWKFCCWILGLVAIDYRIVRLAQRPDKVWEVTDHDKIQCVWTDSLLPEMRQMTEGLIAFHHANGLDEYLLPYHMREVTK